MRRLKQILSENHLAHQKVGSTLTKTTITVLVTHVWCFATVFSVVMSLRKLCLAYISEPDQTQSQLRLICYERQCHLR